MRVQGPPCLCPSPRGAPPSAAGAPCVWGRAGRGWQGLTEGGTGPGTCQQEMGSPEQTSLTQGHHCPPPPARQPSVPCWPGRQGSVTLAFRRLWTVANFCFRACSSAASLDGGGAQRRAPLLPRSPNPTQTPGRARPQTPQGQCGPAACPAPASPRQTHLEALVTAAGSGAGMQKQAAGARRVSPPAPCTTQVCGSVLSTSVYRSPRSSCTWSRGRGSIRLRGGPRRVQGHDGVGVGDRGRRGARSWGMGRGGGGNG